MKPCWLAPLLVLPLATPVAAHSLASALDPAKPAAFDITAAAAQSDGRLTTFIMEVAGVAGSVRPLPLGRLAGAKVAAYVWPTRLDPARVGFAAGSGLLALAITAHPDFDDTPLFDENADGDPGNDGKDWHSHWVVLAEDKACAGGLKVRDVSPGQDLLPSTAPQLPIALDSPGMSPRLSGHEARISVPLRDATGVGFDAVTAELQVHADGGQPMLCVSGVHDVASGDLSLPGVILPQP